MSVKLIAMGNILMKDDGIGIAAVQEIEDQMKEMGIEVIYGETDSGFCISMLNDNDYVIIVDAAILNKIPGEITEIPLSDIEPVQKGFTQHSYSFIDLIKLYIPSVCGVIFAIEIEQAELHFGLSDVLQEKLQEVSSDILHRIKRKFTPGVCNDRK